MSLQPAYNSPTSDEQVAESSFNKHDAERIDNNAHVSVLPQQTQPPQRHDQQQVYQYFPQQQTIQPTVHIQQPGAIRQQGTYLQSARVGDHYLVLSVGLSLLCFLCGSWFSLVCTVPAVILSIMAQDAERRGDLLAAKQHGKLSLGLNIASVLSYIIALLLLGVILLIVYLSALYNTRQVQY